MRNRPNGREIQIMMKLKEREYCVEELGKLFGLSFEHLCRNVTCLKTRGFIQKEINPSDRRIKLLSLTSKGKIFLAKLEARRSAVAKIDSWLDKKFNEIGIDCERLFK